MKIIPLFCYYHLFCVCKLSFNDIVKGVVGIFLFVFFSLLLFYFYIAARVVALVD
jgi:hypothetical protein